MAIDVLVVDDDADLREPLADLLRDEGYEVAELDTADSFTELVEQQQPKLILLDLTLPGADLREVLQAARSEHLMDGRVVLALSGLDEAEEMAVELGLHGAVRKPFDIQALLVRVRSICRPASAEHQPSV